MLGNMAVAKHMEYLNNGTGFWNAWRSENLWIRPVLTGASLDGRDLSGINFLKANLSAASLRGARIRDADLRYTDFSGCNLENVDFTGSNLMLADLTGATLTGAVGLDQESIDDALTDETTILPAL